MMRKNRLIFFFVIGLLAPWQLCWGENYNFRYTQWGMTPEEVIASENGIQPIEKNDNMLKYKTQILGRNMELVYQFADDKLIGSSYKLDENYINSQNFINTYNKFKGKLVSKYGTPTKDIVKWLNRTYKNNRDKWGLALSLGHLEYFSTWQTTGTEVSCSLKEDNHSVLFLVEYKSTEFSNLSKNTEKENPIDPF